MFVVNYSFEDTLHFGNHLTRFTFPGNVEEVRDSQLNSVSSGGEAGNRMRILLVVYLFMEDAASSIQLYTGMLVVGCHLASDDALDEVLHKPKSTSFRFTKPF